jgi:hypothetical protein
VLDKTPIFKEANRLLVKVLGRYDENTKPTSVTGARLDPATGQAKLLTAGGVGEQSIAGQFTFVEDGKLFLLNFLVSYVVVPDQILQLFLLTK